MHSDAGAALAAAVGLALALPLRSVLRSGRHREYDDERALPLPTWGWLPVAMPAGFGVLGWALASYGPVVLVSYLAAGVVLAALAGIDADVHRLPDRLTLPSYVAFPLLLAACSWATGRWDAWLRSWLAAAACLTFYGLLWLASRGRLGLGDVKLAGLLGLLLGWLGWGFVLAGMYGGFLVGALAAVVAMAARRAGLRSHLAFGPAMSVGAVLAIGLPLT